MPPACVEDQPGQRMNPLSRAEESGPLQTTELDAMSDTVSDDVRAYRDELIAEQRACVALARDYAEAAKCALHAALRTELNRRAVALSRDSLAITILLMDGRKLIRTVA